MLLGSLKGSRWARPMEIRSGLLTARSWAIRSGNLTATLMGMNLGWNLGSHSAIPKVMRSGSQTEKNSARLTEMRSGSRWAISTATTWVRLWAILKATRSG